MDKQVELTFNTGGALQTAYLYGAAVDQVLAEQDATGDVRWLVDDNLGSVLMNKDSRWISQFFFVEYPELL
jgi:hypothetical protein